MKKEELNITWLYPDVLNLHGDRGNVMALKKVGEMLNLEVNIKRVDSYSQKIDFDNTDIILINPGEVKVISKIAGNVIVNVKQTRVAISKEMANKIIV